MAQLPAPGSPAEAPGASGVVELLEAAAAEIRQLWQAALDAGDFTETARWVDAGQAVHRSLIALGNQRIG